MIFDCIWSVKTPENCEQNQLYENKNRKIGFSFVSAHSASFIEICPFLRGGEDGLYIRT